LCAAKFCSIGLFGKLQQLMQSEKERDMEFLRKLETGSNANGKACDLFSITPSKKHVDSWKLYAQTRDINI
jgi:hypothetical protein